MYYQSWMEDQAQKLVDATTKAFTQQKMMSQQVVGGMAMGMMPGMPPGMMNMPRGLPMPPTAAMMGMLRGGPPGGGGGGGGLPMGGMNIPHGFAAHLMHMLPPHLQQQAAAAAAGGMMVGLRPGMPPPPGMMNMPPPPQQQQGQGLPNAATNGGTGRPPAQGLVPVGGGGGAVPLPSPTAAAAGHD